MHLTYSFLFLQSIFVHLIKCKLCFFKVMELNLLSLESVVRFAEAWNARSGPLHALINNAGIFSMGGLCMMKVLEQCYVSILPLWLQRYHISISKMLSGQLLYRMCLHVLSCAMDIRLFFFFKFYLARCYFLIWFELNNVTICIWVAFTSFSFFQNHKNSQRMVMKNTCKWTILLQHYFPYCFCLPSLEARQVVLLMWILR